MNRWMPVVPAALLLAATWWHWPAAAQRAAEPAAAQQTINFDQYREYRMHDLQQRQARLTRQLATPGLTIAEKASLERRKAYWDQLATMPAEERDQVFRERFDQIDTNHDGTLDVQERAAWREKQREYYRQQAAERFRHSPEQH
jgi:hypothetical protein